jgi:RimJ/RimL family protein N-acetyltransferase
MLIFFGGIDGGAHTSYAIEAVAGLGRPDLEVDVVIGALHPQGREIEARCATLGYACHVQTGRMAELMARADVALGAGGTASWERCCLGLPTVTLCVAENQRRLVEDAALAGLLYAPAMRTADSARLADHLRALMDNPALLRAISYNAMQAVDGHGTQRVLRAMGFCAVTVREATNRDSSKVFEWRNQPEVRAASRNSETIDRGAHEAWFSAALASTDRLLLIGERDGDDVGVVRFDVRGSAAELSIYLAPDASGRGNGTELLHAAESWLARNRPEVGAVEAEVLRENQQSHGLFRAGGYRLESSRYVKRLA